jgi:hypothetical protein
LRASSRDTLDGVGHDDRPGQRRSLHHRQRDVARTRRQVDDEVIERAPIRPAQKLLNHRMQHWPAPDERLIAGIQKAHRNDLETVLLEWLDPVVYRLRRLIETEHQRPHWGRRHRRRSVQPCVRGRDKAIARFTDTVVLPTPPFPEPTAIVFLMPGIDWGCGGSAA